VLDQGSVAPPFSLLDQDGNVASLDDHPDAWIVLWWFPRADTPG
jgi:thioredoxin-dependent peroxiredoxin